MAAAKELSPEPVDTDAEEEEEDLPSAPDVKEWLHEGTTYYKTCNNDCEEEECDCSGVVYDMETQEPISTWTGSALVALPGQEE